MRQVWVFAGLGIGLAVGGAGAQTKVAQAGGAAPCPEPKVVSAKPSPLPAEMTDDNFAGALARLRTATTAHGTMVSPMHLRYELKMTDVWGKPHTGTYETWLMLGASRLEIHTDTYDDVEVSTCGVRWVLSHGIRPLRVIEFRNEQLMPNLAVQRAVSAGTALKPRTVKGSALLCGGDGGTAAICFDKATGFMAMGQVDQDVTMYDDWKTVGYRCLPGMVRILHNGRMLVEATLTVAKDEVAPDAFAIPEGAAKSEAVSQTASVDVAVDATGTHRVLSRGMIKPAESSGNAQVKVWVDDRGRVTKAVLEDADDTGLGESALAGARSTIYEPFSENGTFVAFESVYYLSIAVQHRVQVQ